MRNSTDLFNRKTLNSRMYPEINGDSLLEGFKEIEFEKSRLKRRFYLKNNKLLLENNKPLLIKNKLSLEDILFMFRDDHDYNEFIFENTMRGLKSKGYGNSMENYGKGMEKHTSYIKNSQNGYYQTLGKISKILSGNYRCDINNIQEENENSSYLWLWEDRINAVEKILKKYKENQTMPLKKGNIGQIFEIIDTNKYVIKKYGDKINKLKSLLLS